MSTQSTRLTIVLQTNPSEDHANPSADHAAAREPSGKPSRSGDSRSDHPLKTARAEVADLFTLRPGPISWSA
jgi:hypothetical protein